MEELRESSAYRFAFIVGLGRSGTTLLSRMLNEHRNAVVSPELEFAIFFYHDLHHKKEFSSADRANIIAFFEMYCERHPVLLSLINLSLLKEELGRSSFSGYEDLLLFLHRHLNFFGKPLQEVQLIVDKNPSYTLHYQRLLELFPSAKFIVMMRDYRANILSRKQSVENRSTDTAFNAWRWWFYTRKARGLLTSHPDISITVKYEDLVISPAQVAPAILQFLSLPEDGISEKYYAGRIPPGLDLERVKAISPRAGKTLGDLQKKIYTERAAAWETQLSQHDIEICEVICGSAGDSFGYKRSLKIAAHTRLRILLQSFPAFLKAAYDYYKEFILLHVSARWKLNRIEKQARTRRKK